MRSKAKAKASRETGKLGGRPAKKAAKKKCPDEEEAGGEKEGSSEEKGWQDVQGCCEGRQEVVHALSCQRPEDGPMD